MHMEIDWQSIGGLLWYTIMIFAFVAYLIILFQIITDLFWRDHTTSGWVKAIWTVFLIIFPFLTALVYLVARGNGMAQRARDAAVAAKAETDSYIREAAAVYGLPEAFIRSIIKVESDFDPQVVSCAGARGLMQIMPEVQEEQRITDVFDEFVRLLQMHAAKEEVGLFVHARSSTPLSDQIDALCREHDDLHRWLADGLTGRGEQICAVNTWIREGVRDERVGDRLVMSVKVEPGISRWAVMCAPASLRRLWASASVSTFTPALATL